MDVRGKTYWEMEKEAISFAHKNENLWIKKAVIAATVNLLERNEQELSVAFKAQDENDPSGHVAQKNDLLAAFFRKVYRLGRKLSFYAKNVGDKVLLDDAAMPATAFIRFTEKEALIKCSSIIKRGMEYLDKTADYDITAEELKDLETELAGLEKMKPSIGVVTNDRKCATRSIKDLITEARHLLGMLDDAFEGMIDDDTFITAWFSIRKIKGRPKPKEKSVNEPAQN